MNLSTMEQYWVWLSSVEGIGPRRFYQLLSIYEDARAVWDNVGDGEMRFLGGAALEKLTPETLTPIEAMNELYKLKKLLNG